MTNTNIEAVIFDNDGTLVDSEHITLTVLMELALDPRFQDGHGFKHAAIPATISFPTRPQPIGFLGPRVWLALVLALGAALAQLALA